MITPQWICACNMSTSQCVCACMCMCLCVCVFVHLQTFSTCAVKQVYNNMLQNLHFACGWKKVVSVDPRLKSCVHA